MIGQHFDNIYFHAKAIEKTRNLNFDESVYYEIISGKTASLLASSCAAGASSVIADEAIIGKMRAFGEDVGMAFQIKDDLLDVYGDESKLGKKVGSDIVNHKSTYVSSLGKEGAEEGGKEEKREVEKNREE